MMDIVVAAIGGALLMHAAHLIRDHVAGELRIRRAKAARERLMARIERRQGGGS